MIAVKLWSESLKGKVVRFFTDNENCMFAINQRKSRDPYILRCLREIIWFTAKFQILLRAKYVKSKDNTLPDALSRWHQSSEARRTVKRMTNNTWKRHSISDELIKFDADW